MQWHYRKKKSFSHLNMEYITDADYTHGEFHLNMEYITDADYTHGEFVKILK